jgi:hypothetical protein
MPKKISSQRHSVPVHPQFPTNDLTALTNVLLEDQSRTDMQEFPVTRRDSVDNRFRSFKVKSGDKASLYRTYMEKPAVLVQSQPFVNTQMFRISHNQNYSNQVSPVKETVLVNQMLPGKTYFTSLKEHVALSPQKHSYTHQKLK